MPRFEPPRGGRSTPPTPAPETGIGARHSAIAVVWLCASASALIVLLFTWV
ncbi:hypothetical protein I549_4368 [Mycobacterium avium subsp. avium 2285 (R)]|nr:hypothetical protein I549_4368 [Mycobacterium avium subsp. avium 2285 (R)]